MKRVLQVTSCAMGLGGVEQLLLNVYNEIDKNEIQFDFLVNGEPDPLHYDEIISLGGRFFCVTPRRKSFIKHLKEMYRIFKENDFHAVHIHANHHIAYVIFLAKRAGIKNIITHSHGTNETVKWHSLVIKMFRGYLRRNAKLCCTCSKEASVWMYGKKLPSEKNKFLPNGINLESFRFNPQLRAEVRRELGVENNLVIGTVGRLSHEKNQVFLIEVISEIVKKDTTAKLVIVGDGELREDIENKIKEYSLENNVLLLGVRTDINRLLQAFDVFALPSYHEGFPVVLVEAQASGLPFVASTGVPKEVDLINKASFISLQHPYDVWAKEILDIAIISREDTYELVKQAGYSMTDIANKWKEMYLSL